MQIVIKKEKMEKEKEIAEVKEKQKIELAKNLMDVLSLEMIAKKTGLSIEKLKEIKESMNK